MYNIMSNIRRFHPARRKCRVVLLWRDLEIFINVTVGLLFYMFIDSLLEPLYTCHCQYFVNCHRCENL